MIDFVFPDNNEQEFIRLAERLGIEGLCFIYDSPKELPKTDTLKLSTAILCTPKNIQKFRHHTTIMHAGDDPRIVLEQHRPNFIFGLESSSRSDFVHHRASGLNQVLCNLAKKNDITILFGFEQLLQSDSIRRSVLMGRIAQNMRFAKKYSLKTVHVSLAKSPWSMRSEFMLDSFFSLLR